MANPRALDHIKSVGGVSGTEWLLHFVKNHAGGVIDRALEQFQAKLETLMPLDHSILSGRLNLKDVTLRREGMYELKFDESIQLDEAVPLESDDCAQEILSVWSKPLRKLSDMRKM